jgi:O-Antigen ligase
MMSVISSAVRTRSGSRALMAAIAGCISIMLGALLVLSETWAGISIAMAATALLPLWIPLGLIVPLRFASNDGVFHVFGGPVTPTDLLILALIVRQMLQLLRQGTLRLSRNGWLLLSFLLWAWLATLASGVSVTPLARVTAYALLALTYALSSVQERRFHLVITLFAFLRLAIAIPYLASGLVNAQGKVGDPHQLGFLLIAGATPLLAREFGGRYAPWLAVPLLVVAAATFRRGIWFALIVLVILVLAPKLSTKRLFALTAALTVAGLVLFAPLSNIFGLNQGSFDYRKETIQRGLDAAARAPVFGSGWAALSASGNGKEAGFEPANASPIAQGTTPASLPVNILAATGLIGLGLFACYFYSALKILSRRSRSAFLLGGAFLALSMFGNTVGADSPVTMLFFLLVAAPAARPSFVDRGKAPIVPAV